MRKHQSLAESFGLVFTETLDRIPLDEDEQSHLYRELLSWAKESAELFPAIHHSYPFLEAQRDWARRLLQLEPTACQREAFAPMWRP